MTRKDYIVIADIIASVQNQYFKGRIGPDDVGTAIALAFCDDAKLDNPNFDVKRFLSRATVKV